MASPGEMIIAVNKDISGISREISFKMSYDNRKGFVENVWVTELLIDGKQISVTTHTYENILLSPLKIIRL